MEILKYIFIGLKRFFKGTPDNLINYNKAEIELLRRNYFKELKKCRHLEIENKLLKSIK